MVPHKTSNAATILTLKIESAPLKITDKSAEPDNVKNAQARMAKPAKDTKPPNAILILPILEKMGILHHYPFYL